MSGCTILRARQSESFEDQNNITAVHGDLTLVQDEYTKKLFASPLDPQPKRDPLKLDTIPKEIRLIILRLVLRPGVIKVDCKHISGPDPTYHRMRSRNADGEIERLTLHDFQKLTTTSKIHKSILSTSRSLNSEGNAILYGENIFIVSLRHLRIFLKQTSRSEQFSQDFSNNTPHNAIRHIAVDCGVIFNCKLFQEVVNEHQFNQHSFCEAWEGWHKEDLILKDLITLEGLSRKWTRMGLACSLSRLEIRFELRMSLERPQENEVQDFPWGDLSSLLNNMYALQMWLEDQASRQPGPLRFMDTWNDHMKVPHFVSSKYTFEIEAEERSVCIHSKLHGKMVPWTATCFNVSWVAKKNPVPRHLSGASQESELAAEGMKFCSI